MANLRSSKWVTPPSLVGSANVISAVATFPGREPELSYAPGPSSRRCVATSSLHHSCEVPKKKGRHSISDGPVMSPGGAARIELSWLLRLRPEPGLLGGMRGGELRVAFGALLFAVLDVLVVFVGLL